MKHFLYLHPKLQEIMDLHKKNLIEISFNLKTKFEADGDCDGVFSGWCTVCMTVPAVINHLYCYFPPPDWWRWLEMPPGSHHLSCYQCWPHLIGLPGPGLGCTRETVQISCQISVSGSIMILTLYTARQREERCWLADFQSLNGDCKISLRRDLAWPSQWWW